MALQAQPSDTDSSGKLPQFAKSGQSQGGQGQVRRLPAEGQGGSASRRDLFGIRRALFSRDIFVPRGVHPCWFVLFGDGRCLFELTLVAPSHPLSLLAFCCCSGSFHLTH